ncbi:MAG TPA: L-lactate permease [Gemmataceae bacterium]|jgi:lactate permease|nr:L-lactate permease [Gemmataceae bacterium]
MLLAFYQQRLNPLDNSLLSAAFAALPVITLFWLLVPRRWLAPKAAAAGAVVAILVAVFVYGMPPAMACMSFVSGAAFGLLPVGWTIFNAMLLYNITVETGHFQIVRRSISGLSGDARIQAILIGFAFGAFLEGAAGGGTPVAICGAILVGLGFNPFLAAVLCLIANTSPVAYGGLGTPLIVLNGVTDIPTETLSIMAGHQLPFLSFIIPIYMVKCMCSWKRTWQVWPALLVAGGSFALFQFTFATIHAHLRDVVVYPMTDIGGGIFSLILTAIFLKFWKPREEWHFDKHTRAESKEPDIAAKDPAAVRCGPIDPHAQAAAMAGSNPGTDRDRKEQPLNWANISMAWAPYAIMSVLLLLSGFVRQMEGPVPVRVGAIQTNYLVAMPGLHQESHRDPKLHPVRMEQVAALTLGSTNALEAAVNLRVADRLAPKPEAAEFNFAWLTAPGTPVFVAALLSMVMLRLNAAQGWRVFRRTFIQMKIPIPTIACMLGLSYVTRYAGMDATLGYAFAGTGVLYPFFAPILGWLGVFLTGTDAGSNALFGSLQKITASEVYKTGMFTHLGQGQAQVLICTSNSTGGVMGKMIDAQSICVATAATNQLGKEADIFKAVFWHSIILATVVGLMTLLQAYVFPFTGMVPVPPVK